MLPQLAMMSKIRGEIEALTSHFVGATALSRAVTLIFWYHGFAELAPLDGSFNLAGWAILAAHVLQVLLLCDFLFYYIRAVVKTGSASSSTSAPSSARRRSTTRGSSASLPSSVSTGTSF